MNTATPALDTRRAIETPEGVAIELHLAGPLPRALAYIVDVFVRTLIVLGTATVLGILGEVGSGILFLIAFVAEWFYPVIFEIYADGRTPGKRWLGLQVLHDDGTPVGWSASIMRNLLRFADFLPFAFGSGLVSALCHPEFKRLGDIASGTVVVYRDLESSHSAVPTLVGERPPARLTPAEQHAILQYSERGGVLGFERASELADLVPALTGDRHGSDAVHAVVKIANWLLGRR